MVAHRRCSLTSALLSLSLAVTTMGCDKPAPPITYEPIGSSVVGTSAASTTSADPELLPTGSGRTSSQSPSTSASPRKELDQQCPEIDADASPMKLVQFRFTSAVENRKPVDELGEAKPGSKVWAYLTMKNLSGTDRCLTVSFSVNGGTRSRVTLDIGQSPSWRTWAYTTLTETDGPGEVVVVVRDDQGSILATKPLRISGTKSAK